MKLLHFADLHIGVETHGRLDPSSGLSTRLQDFLTVFDELVETAITERVDVVLFAGDAYKSRDPSQTQQREFARRIRRLTEAGIPVFLLVGNHDVPNVRTRASALEIFATLDVPRVTIGDRLATWRITTPSGPLQIVGVPWPSVSQMLVRDDLRGLAISDIDRELERRVADGIAREAAALDPNLPAVLVAHIALAGSIVKTSSEQFMTLGRFPQLSIADLSPSYFDYVALGHHHCYQVLGNRPPIVYAGSLQRVDFGEEADPKGFVTVELDGTAPRGQRVSPDAVQFHPVAARPFITLDLEPRADDPTPEVLHAIESAAIADAIVRLRLRLTPAQNVALDARALTEALAPAHVVAGVARDIVRPQRRRLATNAGLETLRPDDALDAYLALHDESEERRALLRSYARRLLDEESSSAEPPYSAHRGAE